MPRDVLRSGRQRERGGGKETETEAESVTSVTLGASATHEVWTRASWCRVDRFPTSVMKKNTKNALVITAIIHLLGVVPPLSQQKGGRDRL